MNKKALAVAVALGLGSIGTAQAFVIDTFDDATPQIVTANGSGTTSTSEAVGDYRTLSITKSGPLNASAVVSGGVYSHNADALTSATSVITWDKNGAGLGGVDLTDGGLLDPEFVFDVESIDQGGINLTISVTDTDGDADAQAVPVPGGFSTGTLTLAFSAFDPVVDFTSVDAISLTVEGDPASDLTLDLLQTQGTAPPPPPPSVPEPGILFLLGGGLLGMLGVRGRRSKQA